MSDLIVALFPLLLALALLYAVAPLMLFAIFIRLGRTNTLLSELLGRPRLLLRPRKTLPGPTPRKTGS